MIHFVKATCLCSLSERLSISKNWWKNARHRSFSNLEIGISLSMFPKEFEKPARHLTKPGYQIFRMRSSSRDKSSLKIELFSKKALKKIQISRTSPKSRFGSRAFIVPHDAYLNKYAFFPKLNCHKNLFNKSRG